MTELHFIRVFMQQYMSRFRITKRGIDHLLSLGIRLVEQYLITIPALTDCHVHIRYQSLVRILCFVWLLFAPRQKYYLPPAPGSQSASPTIGNLRRNGYDHDMTDCSAVSFWRIVSADHDAAFVDNIVDMLCAQNRTTKVFGDETNVISGTKKVWIRGLFVFGLYVQTTFIINVSKVTHFKSGATYNIGSDFVQISTKNFTVAYCLQNPLQANKIHHQRQLSPRSRYKQRNWLACLRT